MAALADFYKRPDVEFQYPGASYKLRFHMTNQEVYLQRYCEFGKAWDRTRAAGYHWAFLCRDDFEEVCPGINADHYVVVAFPHEGSPVTLMFDDRAEANREARRRREMKRYAEVSEPIPVIVQKEGCP